MSKSYLLASASPRRHRILSKLGFRYKCVPPQVEEISHPDGPSETACFNALAKCKWAVERFPDSTVISADTLINFNGDTIGKPASLDLARAILRRLSGQEHEVITAVAVCFPGASPVVKTVVTRILFQKLDDESINEYFSLVDPLDKAGAYDIDQYGGMVVASYCGSYTNIVGLPIEETAEMLGIEYPVVGVTL